MSGLQRDGILSYVISIRMTFVKRHFGLSVKLASMSYNTVNRSVVGTFLSGSMLYFQNQLDVTYTYHVETY